MNALLSPAELERYARQISLDDIGLAGQARLKKGSVLVVGAGGLGSPALLYCAGAGIGRIGIVDHDTLERSNLHRQVIHDEAGLGKSKATSAVTRLAGLNPDIALKAHETALDTDNAAELIADHDFIISAVDSLETKLLISDTCVAVGRPFCHGGIERYGGQVFSYVPGRDACCLRCLLSAPPAPPAEPPGLFGYVPGVIGALQAGEAVAHLVGGSARLVNRMILFDGRSASFREAALRPNPACTACGTANGKVD